MLRWACVVLLIAGCGAKTGAELDPAVDSDTTPTDAGFDTFPCRWSLAQAAIVARSPEPFDRAAAAVHAVRDEVLVVFRSGGFEGGVRLMLGDPPTVLETYGPEVLPPAGGPLHGVRLSDPAVDWVTASGCELLALGDAPPWEAVATVSPTGTCTLEPHDPGRVDVTVTTDSEVSLWSASDLAAPAVERVPVPRATSARAIRLEGSGWILLTVEGGRLIARRVTDGGVDRADVGAGLAPLEVVPDGVRRGAVVLRREAGRWRLDRIPFGGELRAIELADLSVLTAPPTGALVANETEALFPLGDGRVAVVPVDGSAMRFIGPVPEAPVEQLQVVLRPASSGGGLLYDHRVAGEHDLVFRPLSCNR